MLSDEAGDKFINLYKKNKKHYLHVIQLLGLFNGKSYLRYNTGPNVFNIRLWDICKK